MTELVYFSLPSAAGPPHTQRVVDYSMTRAGQRDFCNIQIFIYLRSSGVVGFIYLCKKSISDASCIWRWN